MQHKDADWLGTLYIDPDEKVEVALSKSPDEVLDLFEAALFDEIETNARNLPLGVYAGEREGREKLAEVNIVELMARCQGGYLRRF